jgi:hypothetical protein
MRGKAADGSLLRLSICFPKPSRHVDPSPLLRWAGVLAGAKTFIEGRFQWWPTGKQAARVLEAHQVQLLLAAGNPETTAAPVWRRVSAI